MGRDLLSIGAFARASRLSVRTLRRYADQGLLPPAHVDDATGYRYYRPAQVREAARVRTLRELDVPLAEIREILALRDDGAVKERLERHRRHLEGEIEARREALARLQALIDAPPPRYPVELQTQPPVDVVSTRLRTDLARLGAVMGSAFRRLGEHVQQELLRPTGAGFAITHGEDFDPDDLDVEIGIPCEAPAPSATGAVIARTVAGSTAACTLHRGSYASIGEGYAALLVWIGERELTVSGPPRESYLVGPGPGRAPDDFRTEILWPVAPIG